MESSIPHQTPRPSDPDNEEECPICLSSLPSPSSSSPSKETDFSLLLPCLHPLHESCSSSLLLSKGNQSRVCPLCRETITGIRYNIISETEYEEYIIGEEGDDERWVREDERIKEGMSELERERVRDLRRLRGREEWKPHLWRVCGGRFWGSKNGQILHARRYIELQLHQTASPLFQSTLTRRIKVTTYHPSDPYISTLKRKSTPNLSQVQSALLEAKSLTSKYEKGKEFKVKEGKVWNVLRDERGIEVCVERYVKGCESLDGGEVEVRRVLVLKEEFRVKGVENGEDKDLVEGGRRWERERRVSLAREEVQGVVELCCKRMGKEVAEENVYGKIQRVGTGVLEKVVTVKKCEFCGEKERNGECLLPEVEEVRPKKPEKKHEKKPEKKKSQEGCGLM